MTTKIALTIIKHVQQRGLTQKMKRLIATGIILIFLHGCDNSTSHISEQEMLKQCRENLKEKLKNPFSYREINELTKIFKTRDEPKGKPWEDDAIPAHTGAVYLEYTAENSFGGNTRNEFICYYLIDQLFMARKAFENDLTVMINRQ
jgi:hypothetical protein